MRATTQGHSRHALGTENQTKCRKVCVCVCVECGCVVGCMSVSHPRCWRRCGAEPFAAFVALALLACGPSCTSCGMVFFARTALAALHSSDVGNPILSRPELRGWRSVCRRGCCVAPSLCSARRHVAWCGERGHRWVDSVATCVRIAAMCVCVHLRSGCGATLARSAQTVH